MEEALRAEEQGRVRWSEPRSLRVPGGDGGSRYRVKAAVPEPSQVGGVRVLVFPPEGSGTRWVILFDDRTGEPRAIVDESWSYAHRSIAAVAYVASRVAVPGVRKVSLLGAGGMARAALPYLSHLFPEAEVVVSSRRQHTRADTAGLARSEFGLRASPGLPEDGVRGAQVILGCTSARTAVLDDSWVEPGAVVASLETAECGADFYFKADLRIVDSREQLGEELEECYGPEAPGRVDASMAEIVAGRHPGRTSDAQRILVISQGLASQDVVLAARAYERAVREGMGAPLPIAP